LSNKIRYKLQFGDAGIIKTETPSRVKTAITFLKVKCEVSIKHGYLRIPGEWKFFTNS
jgi:hypothetical protein